MKLEFRIYGVDFPISWIYLMFDKIYQMNHDYEQYDHDNCIANF
jgi:hypothetical protein